MTFNDIKKSVTSKVNSGLQSESELLVLRSMINEYLDKQPPADCQNPTSCQADSAGNCYTCGSKAVDCGSEICPNVTEYNYCPECGKENV